MNKKTQSLINRAKAIASSIHQLPVGTKRRYPKELKDIISYLHLKSGISVYRLNAKTKVSSTTIWSWVRKNQPKEKIKNFKKISIMEEKSTPKSIRGEIYLMERKNKKFFRPITGQRCFVCEKVMESFTPFKIISDRFA